MNKRFTTVLAAALLIAAAATTIFYKLISGRLNTAPKTVTTRLVVAARNLEVGTLIREPDLAAVDWPGPVPQGAAVRAEDIVGRGVLATIYKDEPVLGSRLAQPGGGGGLAAIIPQGMRAFPVRVNEIISVSGFVVPGQRVDVLIAGQPPNAPSNLGTLAKTLLQNMEVLSAGESTQKDSSGKPQQVSTVTLLVTPEQAEVLSLASSETRIQLVLRNPLDTQVAKTPGTATALLFAGGNLKLPQLGGAAAEPRPRVVRAVQEPAAPKEKPPLVIEVFQGGQRTEAKFQERN